MPAYWYEGKPYEFNFSKFWTFCKTKFDCREEDDRIHAENIGCEYGEYCAPENAPDKNGN